MEIKVVSRDLPKYIRGLSKADKAVYGRGRRIVRELTRYANKKMKYYTPRTQRSTGRLKAGIKTQYRWGIEEIKGISFVSKSIKYQFAIEYGSRGGSTISGSPKMSFPLRNWKRAMRNPSIASLSNNGIFVFTHVRRGKYKGKHFTRKALRDTRNYYWKKRMNYKNRISESIMRQIRIGA